jgi:hypothetical protein
MSTANRYGAGRPFTVTGLSSFARDAAFAACGGFAARAAARTITARAATSSGEVTAFTCRSTRTGAGRRATRCVTSRATGRRGFSVVSPAA